jgi:Flp pilus assembly protein TadG
MTRSNHRAPFNQFVKQSGGNVASLFALSAPLLLIALAGAVDYSNAVSTKQRVQAAADAAALAANIAITNSVAAGNQISTTAAQAIATNYFNTNAPPNAVSAETSFSATSAIANGVVTTNVSYQGAPPSLMNGVLGGTNTIVANATATSTLDNTAASGAGQYAGSGYVLGDPHVLGADGSDTYFTCASPSGSWYDLLSDAQFEINVNCVVNNLFAMDAILDITTLLGTHTLQMTSVNPVFTGATHWMCGDEMCGSYQTVTYPAGSWVGDVTIDGVYYPATAGTNVYLSDKTENITVTVTVGQPGVASSQRNYVTIVTPNYTVSEFYYNVGMGYIALTATNAGQCGVPGGIWGETLAGVDDGNGSDFLVPSQTYMASQFYWTSCETVAQTTHLTQ